MSAMECTANFLSRVRPKKGWLRALFEFALIIPGVLIGSYYLPHASFALTFLAVVVTWLVVEQWLPWSILPKRPVWAIPTAIVLTMVAIGSYSLLVFSLAIDSVGRDEVRECKTIFLASIDRCGGRDFSMMQGRDYVIAATGTANGEVARLPANADTVKDVVRCETPQEFAPTRCDAFDITSTQRCHFCSYVSTGSDSYYSVVVEHADGRHVTELNTVNHDPREPDNHPRRLTKYLDFSLHVK
jgi:hypothetical protein